MKTETETLLQSPRWKGGPPVCVAENLGAFESLQALDAFIANQCPSCHILEKWQCKACGMWHSDGVAPDPSGSTSGTTRFNKSLPRRRLKFFERTEGGPLYVPGEPKAEAKTSKADKVADAAEDKRIQKSMRDETGVYS